MFLVDVEGRIVGANGRAARLCGFAAGELPERAFNDLFAKGDRRPSAGWLDRAKREGPVRAQAVLLRKDESNVPVELYAAAIGETTFLVTVHEAAGHRPDDAPPQPTLDAYRMLVDLCHAAVISAGPDARVRSWNPGAEAMFGYPAAEIVGKDIRRLVPPRLREAFREGWKRQARSSNDVPFTRVLVTEALRRDGREVPVELSLAIGHQGGERIFTAVIRDITEQRDTVEKLNDALQRLRFHVERMPFAYIVWDTSFHVLEWNPAAERIFGFTVHEALGRHAYDLIVPPDARKAVDTVWIELLKGDTSSHSINANTRKDGSRIQCEWFNTPLRDSGGRIHGVASMAMDVTEREGMEARLRDAQKLESLGVLAGGVAHDFNSSLMVILGNAALLRSMPGLPSRAQEYLQLIEEAGARANELIKHLLTYARTGRHTPQPTRLNAVVADALTLVRSSLGKRHELRIQLAEALPVIAADHNQLAQIILNLCLNARDAMPSGGEIRISTASTELDATEAVRCVPHDARPGRYVELAVRDNGCGMSEDTVRRMFDPFFTTKPEGHGLGMASVLGILRQHRAFALIDSALGKGTTVRVFFPIR